MNGDNVTPIRPPSPGSTSNRPLPRKQGNPAAAPHITEASIVDLADELRTVRAAAGRIAELAQTTSRPLTGEHLAELERLAGVIEHLAGIVHERIFAEPMPASAPATSAVDVDRYEAVVHVNDRDRLSIDLDFDTPGIFRDRQHVYVLPSAVVEQLTAPIGGRCPTCKGTGLTAPAPDRRSDRDGAVRQSPCPTCGGGRS